MASGEDGGDQAGDSGVPVRAADLERCERHDHVHPRGTSCGECFRESGQRIVLAADFASAGSYSAEWSATVDDDGRVHHVRLLSVSPVNVGRVDDMAREDAEEVYERLYDEHVLAPNTHLYVPAGVRYRGNVWIACKLRIHARCSSACRAVLEPDTVAYRPLRAARGVAKHERLCVSCAAARAASGQLEIIPGAGKVDATTGKRVDDVQDR